MYIMKSLFKSIGMMIYFLVAQIIVSCVIIIGKIVLDTDWFYAIGECIEAGGMFSSEYLSLICEILVPTLLCADIIIMIPIIFHAIKRKEKLYSKISRQNVFFYISIGLVINFIVSAIVNQLPASTSEEYNQLMSFIMVDNPVVIMLGTGIIAPIVEELIFRYCICNFYRNKKMAIFMSAVLFGVAHMNLIQSSYAFVIGLILAYLYVKTDNLIVPTIMHLTINSTSVLYECFPIFEVACIVCEIALIYAISRIVNYQMKKKAASICIAQ